MFFFLRKRVQVRFKSNDLSRSQNNCEYAKAAVTKLELDIVPRASGPICCVCSNFRHLPLFVFHPTSNDVDPI